jgi:aspartyl-tRNA(Asn)/glutamyl-tRNA(Gln) amidotransferase subunit C
MANQLNSDQVSRVASLARLELAPEETEKLKSQLNDILEQFARLQELDTEEVEPTSHSIPMRNVFRDDIAGKSLPREAATQNAPGKRDGNFIVPQIVEV